MDVTTISVSLASFALALSLGSMCAASFALLRRGQNHQHPELAKLKVQVQSLETELTGQQDELAKTLKLLRKLRARAATQDHRERKQVNGQGDNLDDDEWMAKTNRELALGRRP